jgi:hypothetical protein
MVKPRLLNREQASAYLLEVWGIIGASGGLTTSGTATVNERWMSARSTPGWRRQSTFSWTITGHCRLGVGGAALRGHRAAANVTPWPRQHPTGASDLTNPRARLPAACAVDHLYLRACRAAAR